MNMLRVRPKAAAAFALTRALKPNSRPSFLLRDYNGRSQSNFPHYPIAQPQYIPQMPPQPPPKPPRFKFSSFVLGLGLGLLPVGYILINAWSGGVLEELEQDAQAIEFDNERVRAYDEYVGRILPQLSQYPKAQETLRGFWQVLVAHELDVIDAAVQRTIETGDERHLQIFAAYATWSHMIDTQYYFDPEIRSGAVQEIRRIRTLSEMLNELVFCSELAPEARRFQYSAFQEVEELLQAKLTEAWKLARERVGTDDITLRLPDGTEIIVPPDFPVETESSDGRSKG